MDANRQAGVTRTDRSFVSRRGAVGRLGAAGLGAVALGIGAPAAGAQGTPTPEAETVLVALIDAVNRVLAGEETALLDAVVAPDYVNRTPRRSLTTGQFFPADLTGLKASLIELRSLVPDASIAVDDAIAAGDRGAVRFTFRGTPAQATGDGALVTAGGTVFVTVVGGLVVESWGYDDLDEAYAAAVAAAPAAPAPPARGREVVSETREVEAFDEVDLQGIGTLVITQGALGPLTIEAEARVLPRIETAVRDGRLTIRPLRPFRTRQPITYAVSVEQLTAIDVSGAGRVEAARFAADQLRLGVSGAGTALLPELSAGSLDVVGAGDATLELSGAVDRQRVELSGASEYLADDLASRAASLVVAGASQATVRVSETLEANISGAGRVAYYGDPSVTQEVSGAGRLIKVG